MHSLWHSKIFTLVFSKNFVVFEKRPFKIFQKTFLLKKTSFSLERFLFLFKLWCLIFWKFFSVGSLSNLFWEFNLFFLHIGRLPKDPMIQDSLRYSDANWIYDADEMKATTGYMFTLGGGAVSWKSCKQTILTRSTMEAINGIRHIWCRSEMASRSFDGLAIGW